MLPREWGVVALLCLGGGIACDDEEPGTPPPMGETDVGATDAGSPPADLGLGDAVVDACVPTAEECNGVDDDCDGLGDEDLTPPSGDRTDGVCGLFFKQCTGPDGWQEPNYAVSRDYQEIEDRCDGWDNDCDGTVDENLTPPPADMTQGVCEGALRVCVEDELMGFGFYEPDYAAIPGYEAEEMTCDDLDNDCNGIVDEGLAGCMP